MNKTKTMLVAAVLCLTAASGWTGPDHNSAPVKGSKEFEKLKLLEGHWEGTSTHMGDGKEAQKVTVDYHLTSGGSAVVETLFAGTPHEMVSVYTDDPNGHLTMTHYCMMRNQPRMELKKATDSEISLVLAKDGGVDPRSAHMHSLTLKMPKKDQLVQEWTSYDGGKQTDSSVFNFTKKS